MKPVVVGPRVRGLGGMCAALCAFALAACDGTAGLGDEATGTTPNAGEIGQATTGQTGAQVDPTLNDKLAAEGSTEALVVVNDRGIDALVTALGDGSIGPDRRLELVARALDDTKDRVLGRLASHRLATLDRYRNLPIVRVRIDSQEALAALSADPEVARIEADRTYTISEVAPNLSLINQP